MIRFARFCFDFVVTHTHTQQSRGLLQSIADGTRWDTVQGCHPAQEFLLSLLSEKHISGSPECSFDYLSLSDLNPLVPTNIPVAFMVLCLKEFVSVTVWVTVKTFTRRGTLFFHL